MAVSFSVIIPTLNEELFLPRLLHSLTKQSYTNFEVIVVDAGSTDATVEYAKQFTKTLSLKILSASKRGVSAQRNLGAKHSQGKWLIFMDADAVALPHCLKSIDDYLQKHTFDIATSWFTSDDSKLINGLALIFGNLLVELDRLSYCPWAPGALTVISYSVFTQSGGYDEKVTFGEDQAFTIRLVKAGKTFVIIRKVLFRYSARRYRAYGMWNTASMYLRGGLVFFLTGKAPEQMPDFASGGHLYRKSSRSKKS